MIVVVIVGILLAAQFARQVYANWEIGQRAAAIETVRATGQSPVTVPPRWEPAIGALVIGLTASSSGPLPADVAQRMDTTGPPASFYDVLGG